MSYQALYRVFRPQRFEDMAGQEHITRTLQNALLKKHFSHAYLFNGPRGTGKTSAAKILAKAVNCEQAPVSEPCNECEACRGITNGSISDVIEIDAASNNGVDEIRDIRDNVKYAPSSVRYKVYIIDEVHMLSTGAFNALLKTLEEPPAHVIFILATTEPHKIPLTIISRCQRFDFKRIGTSAIISRLAYIVDEENLSVEEGVLSLIAKASEGGMRDALSVLDQVAAYSDDIIKVEDVLEVAGMVSGQFMAEIVTAIEENQAPVAIQKVNAVLDKGKDANKLMDDLIFYYRDLLLFQTSSDLEEMLTRAYADEVFQKQAEQISSEKLYYYMDRLNHVYQDMKRTNHPRILLEMVLIRLCNGEQSLPETVASGETAVMPANIEKLEQRLLELEKRLEQQPAQASSPQENASKEPRRPVAHTKTSMPPARELKKVLSKATKDDLMKLRGSWADIMNKVRVENVAAHAWLLESKPVASSGDGFIQAFKYDFHCQMVMDNKSNILQVVERLLESVLGHKRKLYPIPVKAWEKLKADYFEENKNQTEPAESEPIEEETDPLVTEAEKLVGPDLLEIRD
jgi:DNA polymerase-3 subunit gamma/tau